MINKKIKCLSILLITLLLSGCTIDYNLVVTHKKEVIERVYYNESKELLKSLKIDSKQYLNDKYLSNKYMTSQYGYKLKKINKINYVTGMTYKKFDSLKSYSDSFLYTYLFEGAKIEKIDNITTFSTTGEYYYQNLFPSGYFDAPKLLPSEVVINIRFYNDVVSSNADRVDTFTNTYTWYITNEDKNKNIVFSINNKTRYDIIVIDFFITNSKIIIIGLVSLLLIFLIINYFIKMSRQNNEI